MTRFAVVFACALWLASPVAASTLSAQVEHFTLKNQLQVYVIPNHRIPAVSHMIWYRVGAADDPPGKSGLAHYHEHLMFKSSAKYKTGQYDDLIARNGGKHNAFTGYDATSYYVDIAKEHLPLVMQLEADRMRGIYPSDAETATEKQVIIEERRQRTDNNPDALLREQVNAALFRHHPYHLPVIGWQHEMEVLTKNDVIDFHARYYHPNNAFLVVSGDITAAELRPLAERYYGNLPTGPIPPRRWNSEPPQRGPRHLELSHPNVKQPVLSRTYEAPSLGYGKTEQALPLLVLTHILASGRSSMLYEQFVMGDGAIATSVDAGYSPVAIGPGTLTIALAPTPTTTLENAERALDAALKTLVEKGIGDEALARAKTQLKAASVFERDSLSETARMVGWLAAGGQDTAYFTQWTQKIDAITSAQVLEAAKATLRPEQSVTARLLPGEMP